MMFGLTKPDETITVKPFEVFQKELVLTSSYINPYTQRRALELIDSGRLDVSSMVAKVASLDELGAILSDPACHGQIYNRSQQVNRLTPTRTALIRRSRTQL